MRRVAAAVYIQSTKSRTSKVNGQNCDLARVFRRRQHRPLLWHGEPVLVLLALLGVLLHGGAGIGHKGLPHGLPHPQTQELVRARLLLLCTAAAWKSKSDFIKRLDLNSNKSPRTVSLTISSTSGVSSSLIHLSTLFAFSPDGNFCDSLD